MIICPLEPGGTVTNTCCGPPVATAARASAIPCCRTASAIACPVLALTISSSSNPSIAGKRVTISGQWSGGTSGHLVELWQELPGASTFTRVAQTTTGAVGHYQFVRSGIETNRQFYVTMAGLRSMTLGQRVRAVVTLTLSGLRARGHVGPDHAGERVLLEQRKLAPASGWSVIARPLLSADSTYSVRLPGSGQIDFRTVFRGDRRNVRSVSREFKATA
jgi:hypothetical protein